MLIREDVKRIIEQVIRDLSLDMERSDFTDPNRRTVVLKYQDETISSISFDVVQKREYMD